MDNIETDRKIAMSILVGVFVIITLLCAYQAWSPDSASNRAKRFAETCHRNSGVVIDERCVQVKVIDTKKE